jgi:hypothetical protein
MTQPNLERRVVCAAIRAANGDILVGVRHYSQDMHYRIQDSANGRRFENRFDENQGFVNSWGEYLTREEAYIVARHNNQIIRETPFTQQGKLDSEALY